MVKKRECCDVAAIGTKSRNLHGHTGFGKPTAINLAAGAGALLRVTTLLKLLYYIVSIRRNEQRPGLWIS